MDFSIPLAGLTSAETSLDQTASRIANYGLSPANGTASENKGDSVDLSTDFVSLIQARDSFAANTKVIQTEDQMSRSLLNIIG